MNLHKRATKVANEILSAKLVDKVMSYQTSLVRRELFEGLGKDLEGKLWRNLRSTQAETGAPGAQFDRLWELLLTLRQLRQLGLFSDLKNPPSGGAAMPLRPAELDHIASISTQLEDVLAAVDALASPAEPALAATETYPKLDPAVKVLHRLLCISDTDAWNLGSDQLSDALAEAREIVAQAGPEYVIFSQSEFDEGEGAGFWSNVHGWTELEDATRFLAGERAEVDLPEPADAVWTSLADAHGNVLVGAPKP